MADDTPFVKHCSTCDRPYPAADPRGRPRSKCPGCAPCTVTDDCGTHNGYQAHGRRGEGACDPCLAAAAERAAARYEPQPDYRGLCTVCGAEWSSQSHKKKRCDPCQKEHRAKRSQNRQRVNPCSASECQRLEGIGTGGLCYVCWDRSPSGRTVKCETCEDVLVLNRRQAKKGHIPVHECFPPAMVGATSPLCICDDCGQHVPGPSGGRKRCEPCVKQAASDYIKRRYHSDEVFRTAVLVGASATRASRGGHTRNAIALRWIQRLEYYGYTCWMCGRGVDPWAERGEPDSLEWEHVKPRSKGGHPWYPANIRPACYDCNRKKSDQWRGAGWAHSLRHTA